MGDVLNHLLFLPVLFLQFLIHFQQRFSDCTDLIPSGDIQLGRLIILDLGDIGADLVQWNNDCRNPYRQDNK